MEENNANIEFELTSTSQKGKLSLPKEGLNELLKAIAKLVNVINSGAEGVGKMLKNSTNAIGKPIEALITGKTNEIELANQFITARLMYVKEANATMHLAYVAEELNKKVKNREELPEKIKESDNLYLIQDNASTTSDEDLLKLWAKIYTEEACKPGTVSRKTIKIVETLDKKIAQILEYEILPYCDSYGYFWGEQYEITSLEMLSDYDLITESKGLRYSKEFNHSLVAELPGDKKFYLYPNMSYSSKCNGKTYKLTNSGIEIYKVLKKNLVSNGDIEKIIFNNMLKASAQWNITEFYGQFIRLKRKVMPDKKFIICNKNNEVIFPLNTTYKTLQDFLNAVQNNIEVINNV